jgi:uncharacterized protein (TIGR02646 family)
VISVKRTPEPKVLRLNKKTWLKAIRSAKSKSDVQKAEAKYRHPSVKSALIDMFHGKCAYCESFILHIDYGDIEHFRPKSQTRFRHLIFNWSNLLLSCGICNGSEYKGVKFPDEASGGPIINPCVDDPKQHFEFVYDPVARVATVICKSRRGEITRDLLGLNRPSLREHRSKLLNKLYVLAILSNDHAEAVALLNEAKNSTSEFSAFAHALNVTI